MSRLHFIFASRCPGLMSDLPGRDVVGGGLAAFVALELVMLLPYHQLGSMELTRGDVVP